MPHVDVMRLVLAGQGVQKVDWTKLPDLVAVGLLAWAFGSVAIRFRTIAIAKLARRMVLHRSAFRTPALYRFSGSCGAVCIPLFRPVADDGSHAFYARLDACSRRARRFVSSLSADRPAFRHLYLRAFSSMRRTGSRTLPRRFLCLAPLAASLIYKNWSTRTLRWAMTLCCIWACGPVLWMVRNRPDGRRTFLQRRPSSFSTWDARPHFWYHNRKATQRRTNRHYRLHSLGFGLCPVAVLRTYVPLRLRWNPRYGICLSTLLP